MSKTVSRTGTGPHRAGGVKAKGAKGTAGKPASRRDPAAARLADLKRRIRAMADAGARPRADPGEGRAEGGRCAGGDGPRQDRGQA